MKHLFPPLRPLALYYTFLLLFVLIGSFVHSYAQEGYHIFTCGMTNPSEDLVPSKRESPNNLGSLRSACTNRSLTKYVNVNIIFILRTDGTGNYNESSDGLGGTVSGYQAAYDLIRTANELFANNPQLHQPIGNTVPASPIRIQFLLRGVSFIRNTTAYGVNFDDFGNGDLDGFAVNATSEINIFIAGDPINSASLGASGVARDLGVFNTSPNLPLMLIGDQMWNSFNHGYTKTVFYQVTPISLKLFYYAQILTHEMGHLLNLEHTFGTPNTVDHDNCSDTFTFDPDGDFDPIPPQTNPYNGLSCSTECTNTFMESSLNHFAVTPCQIDRMHNELESTTGMDYYDCDCLSPVSSFSIAEGDYTIYQNTVYLDCEHPGTYVPVFINAAATQNENCYKITVEDLTTSVSYSKIYYGTASSFNLQYVFPNMEVDHVYSVRLKAINTCAEDSSEIIINIEYDFGCGEWFLKTSPNPASETLTIEYGIDVEKETDTEILITEFNNPINRSTLKAKGKQAKGKHQVQINTSTLKNGMYLVTLKTAEKTLTQKVQILH